MMLMELIRGMVVILRLFKPIQTQGFIKQM